MGLTSYALRRLAITGPLLLGVTIVTFALVHALPGTPATSRLGELATEQMRREFEARMGFDKPLPLQYLTYLYRLLQGDWGTSWTTGQPVATDIALRFPATLELAIWALALGIIIGIPLAVISISRRNQFLDKICSLVSFAGVSIPSFWLGLVLTYVFFFLLNIAPPPIGRIDSNVTPPASLTGLYGLDSLLTGNWDALRSSIMHLLLPSVTLAFVQIGIIVQTTRSAIVEILKSEYIRTARAAGFSERVIMYGYALRNALPPVVTMLALNFGVLMSGVIVVEKVFAWPGMASYALNSVYISDYDPMIAYVVITTVMYVFANLASDLACAVLDPRIRYD